MGRSRRGTAPNTRPRASARQGTRSARSPPAPTSTISNEALVLQLQQRHLVTSGSHTARLARLEKTIPMRGELDEGATASLRSCRSRWARDWSV